MSGSMGPGLAKTIPPPNSALLDLTSLILGSAPGVSLSHTHDERHGFDESYFAGLGVSASTKARNGPEVLPRCQATKTFQVAPVSATGIITTFGIFR